VASFGRAGRADCGRLWPGLFFFYQLSQYPLTVGTTEYNLVSWIPFMMAPGTFCLLEGHTTCYIAWGTIFLQDVGNQERKS